MYQFIDNVHSLATWLDENAEIGTRGNVEERIQLARQILKFYRTHTARETCYKFNIPFTGRNVKILHRAMPKGLGLGGKRANAGRPRKQ